MKVVQMNFESRIEFVLEMFYRLNDGKEVAVDDRSLWRGTAYWEPWRGTVSSPYLRHAFAFDDALECWDMVRFPRKAGKLVERAETRPASQIS